MLKGILANAPFLKRRCDCVASPQGWSNLASRVERETTISQIQPTHKVDRTGSQWETLNVSRASTDHFSFSNMPIYQCMEE